jgi:hypothetical protein
MSSTYLFDASATNGIVEVIDARGLKFRIQFDRGQPGFTITKIDIVPQDVIEVNPLTSNKIRVK